MFPKEFDFIKEITKKARQKKIIQISEGDIFRILDLSHLPFDDF